MGRKRRIVINTLGLLLAALVTAFDVQDSTAWASSPLIIALRTAHDTDASDPVLAQTPS